MLWPHFPAHAALAALTVASFLSDGASATGKTGITLCGSHPGREYHRSVETARPTPTLNRRQELGVETVISATRISGSFTVLTIAPSPTAATGCTLHVDHWDCETGGEPQDYSGHDHAEGTEGHNHDYGESEAATDSHGGHSHAGHSHGPSAGYGCVFGPLLLRGVERHSGTAARRVLSEGLFACGHFGTGVLLSTAFVHLLFHGLIGFSNKCIGELTYEALGPAISMAGVWLVFIVDVLLLRSLRKGAAARGVAAAELAALDSVSPATSTHEGKGSDLSDIAGPNSERGDSSSIRSVLQRLEQSEVLVLEAGILFHSVLIGVTLGVATGGFTLLFVAIAFHQFFEGLALGSRLCLTSLGAMKKFMAASVYALITPVGIAIGVGARRSFNSNDSSTLIAIGTLQSLSAGILLYAALELMINDFMRRPGASMSLIRTVTALAILTVGSMLMSVLAKWA